MQPLITKRLAAGLVDLILPGVVQAVLMFIFIIGPLVANRLPHEQFMPRQLGITLLSASILLLKDIMNGRSLGKRLFGLQVVDAHSNGSAVSSGRLILRNIFCILWPIEALLILVGKPRIGDLATSTGVALLRGRENRKQDIDRIEQEAPGDAEPRA